jgi:hypothetical protein
MHHNSCVGKNKVIDSLLPLFLSNATVADLSNLTLLTMGADAPIPPRKRGNRRPEGRPAAVSITLFFDAPGDFTYENR